MNPDAIRDALNGALIVSIPRAAKLTGRSTSQAYRDIAAGEFPLPVRVTEYRRGIRVSDLLAYVEALPTIKPDPADHFPRARKAEAA